MTFLQAFIDCIMQEEGCTNMVLRCCDKYTAICEECSAELSKGIPFDLCPFCHKYSGPSLTLCKEWLEEIG